MTLKLDKENKVIAGVCSGVANSLGLQPTIVRLAFVLGFLLWGIGPLAYIILWLVLAISEKS